MADPSDEDSAVDPSEEQHRLGEGRILSLESSLGDSVDRRLGLCGGMPRLERGVGLPKCTACRMIEWIALKMMAQLNLFLCV